MKAFIHYIVSRSRDGWAVNVDADHLSDHASRGEARAAAAVLVDLDRKEGLPARVVDLSDDVESEPSD